MVQTQKALADGTDQEKFQQLNTLAAMDPGAALDQVNQAQFPSEQYRQAAQMIVVQQLARTSPDEAVALLPNFADPMARINSLLNLWDHIPDTERVLQRKLLDEALLSTRTDLNLTNQGWAVRQVAVRLKQLGEPHDRIRDVLQQATDRVNQVADPQATKAAHGHLALAWALIDSKAALAQSAKADPSFKYSLAQALAVRDPAASERLCADLVASPDGASGTKLWHNVPRVCYRMARVDLDRAKRIADLADLSSREFRRYAVIHSAEPVAGQEKLENVGPVHLKALTYAWMADAVRDTHPAEARQLFQNAVDLLTPLREAIMFDSSGFMHTPSLILVSLFPIAERVHPELIPELFWRALALRLPADSTEDADRISHDISLSLLAGMLARYDRTVARAVIEPVAERERSRSHVGVSAGVWTGLVSTQIDPTWAIAWAESLSDQPLDSLVFGTTQSPRERVLSGIRYRLATEPDTRRAPHVLHAGAWPTVMSVLWMDEFTDPDRRLER